MFFVKASVVFADDGAELSDAINSLLDGLDLSSLDDYLNNYGSDYVFSYGETAKDIAKFLIGGDLGINYVQYLKNLFSSLFSGITKLFPAFAQIVAIAILSAICGDAEGGLLSKTTARAVNLACLSAVLLILAAMLFGIISATADCVNNIKKQIEIISPILITLTVLTGGSEAGAIFKPCAVFLSQGAVGIVSSVIIPFTITVIVINFMSRLNPEISFTGLADLIKSIMKWVMGITVAVFGLFLTAQSSSSSLFNGIFFKVTKYLVGNSVPIVGNFLSAGVDMIVLAGSAVKSAVGLTGIVLLVGEIVPVIISLAAFSLMLKLCAAFCQPLGGNVMYATFTCLSKDTEYLTAGICIVGFLYLITAMIIINTAYAFI